MRHARRSIRPRRPAGRPAIRTGFARAAVLFVALIVAGFVVAACAEEPVSTPAIEPGTPAAPREVNLILRDYAFVPSTLDLVAGETILLRVINGGLIVHEAVFGDAATQAAWERAEAETIGAPPGPTPVVVVAPEVAGLRVVVESGKTTELRWTVPQSGPSAPGGFLIGCHIPGHFAKGMVAGVRWIGPDGVPLEGSAARSGETSAGPSVEASLALTP